MTLNEKGKSPFYPGQPVPVELFVGRRPEIERVGERGVKQVAAGKPMAFFVQGEYGIGKSSIATYLLSLAEKEDGLLPIYASVGGAKTLDELAIIILEATLQSGAYDPTKSEILRHWLAKYIGEQKLFGFGLDFKALKQDAPNLTSPFRLLGFLGEARKRLKSRGIFLVLDEINGITANADFAHFIKGLIEQNAQAKNSVPLLVGKKYVDQQVYRALHSEDYHSILAKIAKLGPPETMSFTKSQIAADLTPKEKSKLNNFLQKMKKLNVIKSGDSKGEYVFCVRMVRLYIWLRSVKRS